MHSQCTQQLQILLIKITNSSCSFIHFYTRFEFILKGCLCMVVLVEKRWEISIEHALNILKRFVLIRVGGYIDVSE